MVAIPGIVLAGIVIWLGGPAFAALAVIIALLGLNELFAMTAEFRPLRWAAHLGAALTIIFAWLEDNPAHGAVLGLSATLGLTAIAGLILARREEVGLRVGITLMGALYLGLPLALLVGLRDLPDGAAAVVNVLVGTWAFDTASYFGGKMYGRRPVAPRTSPGKTLEGVVAGAIGGVLAVWIAGLYMDWIDHLESLALGAAICAAAFVGDLFESMIKRDAGVKDSGRLLLGHGGVLDRFDSLLFAAPAAYAVTVAIL